MLVLLRTKSDYNDNDSNLQKKNGCIFLVILLPLLLTDLGAFGQDVATKSMPHNTLWM